MRATLPDMVARNSGRVLKVTSTTAELPGLLQAICFASRGRARYPHFSSHSDWTILMRVGRNGLGRVRSGACSFPLHVSPPHRACPF